MENLTSSLERLRELGDRQMEEVGIVPFFLVLALSLASAFFVAYLYSRFYGSRQTGTEMHRAFPLLGLSITAIFICIQFSLPLSLGLLGALSIVRFRTPVKEPEEIGFLMVVIAASLACATFNFAFLAIILVIALIAAAAGDRIWGKLGGGGRSGVVLLSAAVAEFDEKRATVLSLLAERIRRGRLESLARHDGEMVLTYSFRELTPSKLADLEEELSGAVESSRFSVAYQRSGV